MGLLKRLFGSAPQQMESSNRSRWQEDIERFGDIRVDVVGESNYQPAIRSACAWEPGKDTKFECMAELVPEPSNRYDPNAIMVQIDGDCVGYLSRGDVVALGPAIKEAISRQGAGICRAVVVGRAQGETDNLGVFLHLDAEMV